MRRIKKAKIQFISLVARGANQMPVIYKSDGSVVFDTLFKASEDAGELTSIVYAVEHRDSQGDIASAEVIKDMAYEAMRNGLDVDIRHNGKALGKDRAYVAESFLVQKGDPRFVDLKDLQGRPVNAEGAWANVIKIDDEAIRAQVRSGEIGGLSMAGDAIVEAEKSDDADAGEAAGDEGVANRIIKGLARLLGLHRGEDEIEMKKDELEAILKANNEALATTLSAAIAKALTPSVETTDETTDQADDVAKEDATTDEPADEFEAVEDAVEAQKSDDSDPRDTEIAELKAKLEKLESRSKAPVQKQETDESLVGLSKEDAEAVREGREMARIVNEMRGFSSKR